MSSRGSLLIAYCLVSGCTEISFGPGGAGGSGPTSTGSAASTGAAGGSGGASMVGVGGPAVGAGGAGGGCDADLDESPGNCGACGHDCAGGDCAAGLCQPLVLLQPAGVSVHEVVAIGDDVFAMSSTGLYSMKVDDPPGSASFVTNTTGGTHLAIFDGRPFWTSGTVHYLDEEGAYRSYGQTIQCSGDLAITSAGGLFCVYEDFALWTLFRHPNDSNWFTNVAPGVGIATLGEDLVVSTPTEVVRVPINDPASPETLVDDPALRDIVTFDSSVFFGSGTSIFEYQSGAGAIELVTGVANARVLHVDETDVYFATGDLPIISRVSRLGANQNGDVWVFEDSDLKPSFMAGDDTFLFFSAGAKGLYRIRKPPSAQ